jgi:hypothetical protein
MKTLGLTMVALYWVAHPVVAQTTNLNLAAPTNSTSVLAEKATERAWSFSASVTGYLVPDDRDYAQPTVTADRGWLHLEARYNYEALETGSVWVGYNFSVGEIITFDLTPMVGGVFGDLTGIAPGYEATLSWWKLELYSEGEYVIDTGDHSQDFFYSWSELSLAPVDWFRFGFVAQRTKAYETDFDIQRGFLIGFSVKRVDFTTYVFNPDDKPTVVLAMSINF